MTSLARPRANGFTLIELLVVLVIIGVLASMISLAVGGRATDDRMQAESRRVSELLKLASDEAQAKGLELGFRLVEGGFDFLTPAPDTGTWEVVGEGSFRPREVIQPFVLELRVDGRLLKPAVEEPEAPEKKKSDGALRLNEKAAKQREPQLLILSTGEMTPFTLDLRLPGTPGYYRIEGNALAQTTVTRRQDDARTPRKP